MPVLSFGRLATLVLLLTAVGCRRPAGAEAPMPSNEVSVQVVNHHWGDLVIHFQPQGRSERLGLARTSRTSNFFLPFRRLEPSGQFRLRADEIGGYGAIISELIVVQPGQTVEWTVENRMTRSVVVVR